MQPDLTTTPTAAVVGGAQLNFLNGEAACTSAFPVIGGGRTGVLTAGHCKRPLNYGNSTWLTFQQEHEGHWGDLEWYSSSVGALPQFQYSAGKLTTIRNGVAPYRGQIVNRYGRNTTDWGLKIDAVNSWETYSNGKRYGNVSVTWSGCSSVPGDSGGPVWNGAVASSATAVGVLSGHRWTATTRRCIFTPVVNMVNVFGGLSVHRQP